MTAVVNLVVMLGMFVVVPVGLRLVDDLPAWWPRLWRVGALPGAASLWLPRGWAAAILAGAYAVMTVALAVAGLLRWTRRPSAAPRDLALLTALVAPSVAGVSLVAERYGVELFGFRLPTLTLTVAHFHFAGFAAALIAALLCSSRRGAAAASVAALCVPAGLATVLAGFFVGPAVELAGTVVLTVGLWLMAWLIWRERGAGEGRARTLFAVAAVVPVGTMALAVAWALGRAVGLPHPSIDWMVATHGVANAVGFALCAVLAWRRVTTTRG
jgi:hypothetical protein